MQLFICFLVLLVSTNLVFKKSLISKAAFDRETMDKLGRTKN